MGAWVGLDRRAETVRKRFEHFARQPRQHAIGEAGDRILFVNHQGFAREPSGETAGAADKAASAKHDDRPPAADNAQALPNRTA